MLTNTNRQPFYFARLIYKKRERNTIKTIDLVRQKTTQNSKKDLNKLSKKMLYLKYKTIILFAPKGHGSIANSSMGN